MTTARHRAIDRLRRDRVLAAKLRLLAATAPELAVPETTGAEVDETEIPDERLELIFTCCHPALAAEAQVALTLRAVAGLGTEEIASSFLVSAETMKRRLTRAKTKIRDAGIPFSVPSANRLPERLAVVLAVVYLIFNQGYSAPGQAGHLATEAIRLGRVLASLLPDEPEPRGLLALMLLHDARRRARLSGADGQDLVLLADQDRSLWDRRQIAEAREIIERIVESRGPYLIQAAIASLQAADPVDWRQVAALYAELAELTGSPVVRLNGAVAIAEADGPAAALAIVDRLNLAGYAYWHSTRAELLRRLGRLDEARAAYRDALALAGTEPERRFLRGRIAEG
jgi:RNA polymerase sigma-70 factor (ECF subfamily)